MDGMEVVSTRDAMRSRVLSMLNGTVSKVSQARKTILHILSHPDLQKTCGTINPELALSEAARAWITAPASLKVNIPEQLLPRYTLGDERINEAPTEEIRRSLLAYRVADWRRQRLLGHHGLKGELPNGLERLISHFPPMILASDEAFDPNLKMFCDSMDGPSEMMSKGNQLGNSRLSYGENRLHAMSRLVRELREWLASEGEALPEGARGTFETALETLTQSEREVHDFMRLARAYVSRLERTEGNQQEPQMRRA